MSDKMGKLINVITEALSNIDDITWSDKDGDKSEKENRVINLMKHVSDNAANILKELSDEDIAEMADTSFSEVGNMTGDVDAKSYAVLVFLLDLVHNVVASTAAQRFMLGKAGFDKSCELNFFNDNDDDDEDYVPSDEDLEVLRKAGK